MDATNVSRRGALKAFALWAGALFLGGTRALAAKPTTPISETNVSAKALGYAHDAAKADPKKVLKLKEYLAAGNNCSNCLFYTATKDGWGECKLLTQGLVNGKGLCMSYSKKS